MMQSDLMAFRPEKKYRSLDDIDNEDIRQYILSIHRKVIHAGKIKHAIIKDFDIYLEDHEDRALTIRVGITLSKLYAAGLIKYFGRNQHYILYYIE